MFGREHKSTLWGLKNGRRAKSTLTAGALIGSELECGRRFDRIASPTAAELLRAHLNVYLRAATIATALALGLGFGAAASAADLGAPAPAPVYTKAPPVPASSWYVFVDGTYENVALPSNSLGLHNASAASGGFLDNGPVNNFSTRLNGDGVRGGIGFFVPGTQWRLEARGSYVDADGTQNQSGSTTSTGILNPVFLNGTTPLSGFNCFAPVTCGVAGQLHTNYDSWQATGKAAYDLRAGSVGVSPFAALFGGSSRDNQTLSQTFVQTNGGAITNLGSYDASTALTWNDFGGRIGLDAKAPVTNWLAWNFTGWAGLADRRVSLIGSDANAGLIMGASTIASSATATALVANLESGFAVMPLPSVTLRAFGGVNFDNRVPGITAPAFAGSALAPTGGTPAGINFSSETSYYAGGGVLWKF
jgi:hypothetical protein